MRVTPNLEVLDTVYICNREGGQNIPAVVFNGENYVTVWYDPGLTEGIVAARVTPQGAVLDTGVRLGPGDDDPDIASVNGRCLAVWSRDYSGVWARLLDGQAQPLDTLFRVAALNASCTSPKAATDGQNFLVVWADFGPTGDLDVSGRILTGAGQMPGDVFSIARGPAVQQDPSLSFDGDRYLVVWLEDAKKILGQFLGTDGKPVGGPFLISDTSSIVRQYPSAAQRAGEYLAVWAEYHDGFDIYATLGSAINVSERGAERVASLSVSPNPFRSAARISIGPPYGDQERSDRTSRHSTKGIEIKIYNAAGRFIRSFALGPMPYAVNWNGYDRDGRVVPAGVYFVRFNDGSLIKIIKIE